MKNFNIFIFNILTIFLFPSVSWADGIETNDNTNFFINTITYLTDSYELSEDGKTLVKWTGPETEIDMSSDPAFDNVTEIGYKAFKDLRSVKKIILSSNIKKVGTHAFDNCPSLEFINLSNITEIGACAFQKCISLSEISLPDGIRRIKTCAFSNCRNLKGIIIPKSVDDIEHSTIYGCNNLKSIIVDKDNPYYDSRYNCNAIIHTATNTLIQGCTNTVIPKDITVIGMEAFSGMSELETITIPESVTSIGEFAFSGCSGLTSITIPEGVTSIGIYAFEYCKNLNSIISYIDLPFNISDNVFKYNSEATLYVPTGTAEAYRATEGWKNFVNIVEMEETCDLSDLPTNNAYYDATAFLCERGVLNGSKVDGKVNVNNPLKRAHLAKIAFRGLYSLNGGQVPANMPSDNYPTVYSDLTETTNENAYYRQAARALMYLEYGDGVVPFDRDRLAFEPEGSISRLHTLKALMETFNIKPDLEGTNNPFPNDPDCQKLLTANPMKFGYIRRAAHLGIITTENDRFHPNEDCLRGESFVMLARIMQKIETGEIADPQPSTASYFEPLNITLQTLSMGTGMQMGNFNNYAKSSFNISGIMPLNFAHTYDSYSTTLPSVFYGARTVNSIEETYRPMGPGWSHTYHTFMTMVGTGEQMRAIVHWGGGNIDIYRSNGTRFVAESIGIYDEFTMEGSEAIIKTKGQITYRFSNQGGTGAMVLYLKSITDRNGNTLSLTYTDGLNGTKNVSCVSDGHRQLQFTYKRGTNLLESVTDPLERKVNFNYTYNAATDEYMLTGYTDAKGQITTYTYGESCQRSTACLLTRIQLPKGNYVENQYDQNRRLSQTTTGTNDVPQQKTNISVEATYEKTVSTRSMMEVEHDGTSRWFNFDFDSKNNLIQLTGIDDLQVNSEFADAAHPTQPTAFRTGRTNISSIVYDERGNVTSITADGLTQQRTVNQMNDVTSITDPRGNTTRYDYDARGNLTCITDAMGGTTQFTVDDRGLTTKVVNPEGIAMLFSYNEYGNKTTVSQPVLGTTVTTEWNKVSRPMTFIDAKGQRITYSYDNLDNLTSETDPMGYTTTYNFDANNNLTSITNAQGGVTSMTYDFATDFLTSTSFGGSTKQMEWNEDGTLATFVKPDGTHLEFEYDRLGRILSDGIHSYTYDGKMHLNSISEGEDKLVFEYDDVGRVSHNWYNRHYLDGATGGTQCWFEYDENGNTTKIKSIFGYEATYTYDALNRITSLSDGNGHTITYEYRKDGKLKQTNYPNGMHTDYGYDAAGRLVSKKTTLVDGKVIASYNLHLDDVGNIVEQKTVEPYMNELDTETEDVEYSYDTANRITEAGSTYFSFDANGNTMRRGSDTYFWDVNDRLTKAGDYRYGYDPLGYLAYMEIPGQTGRDYIVDVVHGGNVLLDYTERDFFYHGACGLEACYHWSSIYYYVTDIRGSVVAMVDENGNITHRYQYDEFGNVLQSEEQYFNPFRYIGQYGVMYNSPTRYYMRARHYDPTIGRFLSEDPVWSTNLYPYAENNPIMNVDPQGYQSGRYDKARELDKEIRRLSSKSSDLWWYIRFYEDMNNPKKYASDIARMKKEKKEVEERMSTLRDVMDSMYPDYYNHPSDEAFNNAPCSYGNSSELEEEYNRQMAQNKQSTPTINSFNKKYSDTGNVLWDIQQRPDGKYYLYLEEFAKTIFIPMDWVNKQSNNIGRLNEKGIAGVNKVIQAYRKR